ncbi:MAG: redoxin domain-containing protein [Gammaproteobacteria bacterium]|nr:redoxin domain-containing protein [Gammaproteobacteria bacterium]MDD9959212.1 redoxin domain-containing protein [Gammaproteobacteria bacterium]
MKNTSWALSLLMAMLMSGQASSAAIERVGNFALLDHEGSYHQLRKYGESSAVVIISTASTCFENIEKLPKYRLLRTTWENQGVSFLAINSSPADDLESIRQMDSLHNVDLPILIDNSQLVAESLGLTKAGEIIVLEPNRFQVLYRGGLDIEPRRARPERNIVARAGTSALADTLAAAVAGELDSFDKTVVTETIGCNLDFPARDQHAMTVPDYATEVAPILEEKCVSCHIEGGIAPFAMDSHMMVQGWSPMMKEVIMTKRMPPAQVDPSINHFINARYMDPEQLQTLVHWIDAGAPRGNGTVDPLTKVNPSETVWELGEPDYVVEVPAFTVPATGVLDYENVTINLPFEEDVWVKSVQHIPGDRRVLHHLLSYIVPADYDVRIVEGENDSYREFLEGYAPGKDEAATYPENSGMIVPKGSAVQMSLHYTTFGKETVDKTLLGLYFADEKLEYQYSTYSLSHGGRNIVIPPRAAEHKMSASYVFADEVMLHGLRPHMHYRGKYMRFTVIYPDGTKDDIINVPDYNFAWQPTYRLADPMLLPAGSRVMIEGAFDNSQYNLGNPDPDAEVRGGAQSWDEMFIGYFSYHKTGN